MIARKGGVVVPIWIHVGHCTVAMYLFVEVLFRDQ